MGAPDRDGPHRESETTESDGLDQDPGREADPTSGDEFASSLQPTECARTLCVADLISEEVPKFDSDESTSSDDGQAKAHNPRLVRPAPRGAHPPEGTPTPASGSPERVCDRTRTPTGSSRGSPRTNTTDPGPRLAAGAQGAHRRLPPTAPEASGPFGDAPAPASGSPEQASDYAHAVRATDLVRRPAAHRGRDSLGLGAPRPLTGGER